jgi:D-alanine-D-alanine ligase
MDRCLILYNSPADEALADEIDVLEQVEFVSNGLRELGYKVDYHGLGNNLEKEIIAISKSGYDFVFNLVEAVYGYAEILHFVPSLLNLWKIPHSGCPADAAFITANKVYSKKLMKLCGIPVAENHKISNWRELTIGKKYILKPVWEDGSVGINEDSVFIYEGEKPSILENKVDSHWFIENYLDGREFNVSIIANGKEPLVLPPAEMTFRDYPENMPKIVSYKAKWEENSFQYKQSVRSFDTDISEYTINKMRSIAIDCWHLFNLHGYARIDMRTNKEGELFVMEANANPCISADSGFVAACFRHGLTKKEIIANIISDLNNPKI